MLQNAYLVAKIGADTAENEQHFAEILPIGRRVTGQHAGPGSQRLHLRPVELEEAGPAAVADLGSK